MKKKYKGVTFTKQEIFDIIDDVKKDLEVNGYGFPNFINEIRGVSLELIKLGILTAENKKISKGEY